MPSSFKILQLSECILWALESLVYSMIPQALETFGCQTFAIFSPPNIILPSPLRQRLTEANAHRARRYQESLSLVVLSFRRWC